MGFGFPIAVNSGALGAALSENIKMKPVAPGARAAVAQPRPAPALPTAPAMPAFSDPRSRFSDPRGRLGGLSGVGAGGLAGAAGGLAVAPGGASAGSLGAGGALIKHGSVATYIAYEDLVQLIEGGSVELDVDVSLQIGAKRTYTVPAAVTLDLDVMSGDIRVRQLDSELCAGLHVECLAKAVLQDGDRKAKIKQKKKSQLKALPTEDPCVLSFGPDVDYSKHCDSENDIGEFHFSGIFIGCIE